MDEEPQFLSTQMQAAHEMFEEQEHAVTRTESLVSKLAKLRNPKAQVAKPPAKRKPKLARKKIQSMSSYVRDRAEPSASILEYFSGQKRKVGDIIRRIELEERRTSSPEPRPVNTSYVYSHAEWVEIVRSIKLRFPELSSRTKRTLKAISRQIEGTMSPPSMWSQASALPSDGLDDEAIKWLYDLDEDQMTNDTSMVGSEGSPSQFVVTLSQVCKGEEEEVEDSSSDPEYLDMYISSAQVVGEEELPPLLLGEGSPQAVVPTTRMPSMYSQGPIEVEEIFSSKPSPRTSKVKEVPTTPQKKKVKTLQTKKVKTPQKLIEVTTPQKLGRQSPLKHLEVSSTPLKTPPRPVSSPWKLDGTPTQISDDEVYSTARTQVSPTKRLHVKGFLTFAPGAKVRRIEHQVINLDSDNEVEDSDDDNSISVIEIVDDPAVMQVPSSPRGLPLKSEVFDVLDLEGPSAVLPTQVGARMDDYSEWSFQQLRNLFERWGLRPYRSKAAMVAALDNLTRLAGPTTMTAAEFTQKVHDAISTAIRNNPEWFARILTYEPVHVPDLQRALEGDLGVLDPSIWVRYCDAMGITTTNESNE